MSRFGKLGQEAAARDKDLPDSEDKSGDFKKFDFSANRSLDASVAANAANSKPANEVDESNVSEYESASEEFA